MFAPLKKNGKLIQKFNCYYYSTLDLKTFNEATYCSQEISKQNSRYLDTNLDVKP